MSSPQQYITHGCPICGPLPDTCVVCDHPSNSLEQPSTSNLATVGFSFPMFNSNCYMHILKLRPDAKDHMVLKPEDIGLAGKSYNHWKQWVNNLSNSSKAPPSQKGSPSSRNENLNGQFQYPTINAICWPLTEENKDLDYHWAFEIKENIWSEQAGMGGPARLWTCKEAMLKHIKSRTDSQGTKCYNSDSIEFSLSIPN